MKNITELESSKVDPKNHGVKILYTRTSSLDQRTDRQRVNEKEYDLVIEDKISGAVEFFKRPGGSQLKKLVEDSVVKCVCFWEIYRAGRSMIDILQTVKFFSENSVQVIFISEGIKTLDDNGKESIVGKLFVYLGGAFSEINRLNIREAQRQGIELAKARGVYKGRKQNTKESVKDFLNKKKNMKALELLSQGYKGTEVSKIVGLSPTTVCKIKKLGIRC